MSNIAEHLHEIAHLYGDKGETWKAQAFESAAKTIAKLPNLQFNNGKLVDKIAGVGKSIQTTIEEFAATGTSNKMKELGEVVPIKETTVFLKEVTEDWNTDFRVPLHTYLVDGDKMLGYIPEGKTKKVMFSHPMRFDKRGRKFTEIAL